MERSSCKALRQKALYSLADRGRIVRSEGVESSRQVENGRMDRRSARMCVYAPAQQEEAQGARRSQFRFMLYLFVAFIASQVIGAVLWAVLHHPAK